MADKLTENILLSYVNKRNDKNESFCDKIEIY